MRTALRGRSGFSWNCSLRTLQEVSCFCGRGEAACIWRKKWASAMPPEAYAWRNTSGHCSQKALILQSCLTPWTRCGWDGEPCRTGVVLLFDQTAYSLWVSLARAPEQDEGQDVVLLEMLLSTCFHPELVFLSGAETSVWQFKRAAGFPDCPVNLEYLTCCRQLRAARADSRDSCGPLRTTPSSLNQTLSWRGLRSGSEKSWR